MLMSEVITLPLPETTTSPTTDYRVMTEADLDRPYRVIIENDDTTPMEFVVTVLRVIFVRSNEQAVAIMREAHTAGRALVVMLPLREAQDRVYDAHSQARAAGYPLSFYLEPAD